MSLDQAAFENQRSAHRAWLSVLLTMRGMGAWLVCGVWFFVLDLCWLGLVAKPVYDALLQDLKADQPYWPAAILFYLFYITTLFGYAVAQSISLKNALRRGAFIGFVAYTTYELTNWAVIRDWPGLLVPFDVAWGLLLTSSAAGAGYWILSGGGEK